MGGLTEPGVVEEHESFRQPFTKGCGLQGRGEGPTRPQGDRPPPRPAAQQDGRRESAPFGTPLLDCPLSRLSPAPPPQGEASLGAPYGGDGRQWRPSIAGLRSHDRRSWTRPIGAQDPTRQARRCHRKAMTEGVTGYVPPAPLPPPVVLVCAGGRLTATGGGILYTLIPKGDCIPLREPPY